MTWTACLARSGIPFDRMGTIRPYKGTNEHGKWRPSWNSICNFLAFELAMSFAVLAV
jgi:hypothetical protein